MTVTDFDWVLCAGCHLPIYGRRLDRNLRVCPQCDLHLPLTAAERLTQLADDGDYELLTSMVGESDPLGFVDTLPYLDRLEKARVRTGMDEAVLCARARIEGLAVILAVMDFRFLGGSLGTAVGELITQAAETAVAERTPLVIVSSSGGARMQEGVLSLMQMAKTSAVLGLLDDAGILTVSVIADPTFGGVAASFATLADVLIAEPGARLGFAGRRVIEQTIRQTLPPEFQTAEFLLERGFIDLIVPRQQLRRELARLLRLGSAGVEELTTPSPVVRDPGLLPEPDPWGQTALARSLDRPTTLDYLSLAFTDFRELHGDRTSGECAAIVGGVARLAGRPVVVIGHQKGHTPAELQEHNYGMASPAGYRKAARLMRLADKLGLPLVTLVDTPGAFPGADAEEQGQSVAIAENLRLMASLRVPVVSVIIGEGGSGGALGLAVANRVMMFANSIYSVISPEGCASIIWKDAGAAPLAADALGINSRDLLRLGVVDEVIPEPSGGTGADPLLAADHLRSALAGALRELAPVPGEELRSQRFLRFRQFGSPLSVEAEFRTLSSRVR